MNLFLDTSVMLAACGSARGASRAVFEYAPRNNWSLLASPYALSEVVRNLDVLPGDATADWVHLRKKLIVVDDILSLDRPVVFAAAKDRPILFTALGWAKILLTLDQNDFGELLGGNFYGLEIMKPAAFLQRGRAAGTLKVV